MPHQTVPMVCCKERKNVLHKKICIYMVYSALISQDHRSVIYKHKHMLKKGAPPEKFRVLYRRLLIQCYVLTTQSISKHYHPVFHGIIFNYLTGSMGTLKYDL